MQENFYSPKCGVACVKTADLTRAQCTGRNWVPVVCRVAGHIGFQGQPKFIVVCFCAVVEDTEFLILLVIPLKLVESGLWFSGRDL